MSAEKKSAFVYEGVVGHRRFKPVQHALKYRVFSFLLDLDALDQTASTLRYFSRNKFNLFSFYDRDFGDGASSDIAARIRQLLHAQGIANDGRILLLCYPRMLGYAFNPLAVYYCYDRSEKLTAVLYEVRNTFGGKHCYLIPCAITPGSGGAQRIEQETQKLFHVSPFIDMDMQYRFSLSRPSETISVDIQTSDRDGPLLSAYFSGEGAAITDRKLLSLFFRYPLMTMKVIFGIHWEALKLMLKGLRLRAGAPDPENLVTVVSPAAEKIGKVA